MNKERVHIPIILMICMAISSCSFFKSDEQVLVNDADTLADLQPAVMPQKNVSLPSVDVDTLIKVYNDVLAVSPDPELQVQVLHRLAGLEMKKGEIELNKQQESGQFDVAISAYQRLLKASPNHEKSDQLRYQLSKAYDLSGNVEQSMSVLNDIVTKHANSPHYGEVQFRRAEIFFSEPNYRNAELAYAEVIKQGESNRHYKNALYMHGWSLFKQERYRATLRSFVKVLDINVPSNNDLTSLKAGDRELTSDVLRVMSVVFSYLEGPKTIAEVFSKLGERHYLPLLYAQLGKLYLDNERYADSAETFRSFVRQFPQSDQSPVFYGSLIKAYVAGAFVDEVLREKELYIQYYGIRSQFWQSKTAKSRDHIRPYLKTYLPELARYYHAQAQKKAKSSAVVTPTVKSIYLKAGKYYQEFVDTFPNDVQTPEMVFLLAESRFEAGDFAKSVDAYETVAYQFTKTKRATQAGYSAIIAYSKQLDILKQRQTVDTDAIETWLRFKINSQLRFASTFRTDKRASTVLAKSSEELLQLKEFKQALDTAQLLVAIDPPPKKSLMKTGWLVIGHSQFERKDYKQAEIAYQQTLALLSAKDKTRPAIIERLAASVYKQGEVAQKAGSMLLAAEQFLRVASVSPGSPISITAQYDAASAFMNLSSWKKAIAVLTRFRKQHPKNKLTANIPAKLVVAYQESGQYAKAADELTTMYNTSTDNNVKRETLYQAAELYEKSGNRNAAIDRYRRYAHGFPEPFDVAMEARFKLTELYLATKDQSKRRFWLKKIITADATAGNKRTDRSRYLAAFSSNVFANDHYYAFKKIPLKLPLKNSFKKKKKALKRALTSYQSLAKFGVQEFTTLATYRIASIYQLFSNDLMGSERPKGLDELALEEYDILLEEKAFPFEEKSISIHEANAQRSWQGTYDAWIKESFSSLRTLLPARYAKDERGVTFDNEIY